MRQKVSILTSEHVEDNKETALSIHYRVEPVSSCIISMIRNMYEIRCPNLILYGCLSYLA